MKIEIHESISKHNVYAMSNDKNRTGEEYSIPAFNFDCPLCKEDVLKRTKGHPADWVREYTCQKCKSVIQYNEGDKMGGQFDHITIVQDNYIVNN